MSRDKDEIRYSFRSRKTQAEKAKATIKKLFKNIHKVLPEQLMKKEGEEFFEYGNKTYFSQANKRVVNAVFMSMGGEMKLREPDENEVKRAINKLSKMNLSVTTKDPFPLTDNDLADALWGDSGGTIPTPLLGLMLDTFPHISLLSHVSKTHPMPHTGRVIIRNPGNKPARGNHLWPQGLSPSGENYGTGNGPGTIPVSETGIGPEYKAGYGYFDIEVYRYQWYSKYSNDYLDQVSVISDGIADLSEDFNDIFTRRKDLNMTHSALFALKFGRYYRPVSGTGDNILWDHGTNCPYASDIQNSSTAHKYAVWADISDNSSAVNGIFGNTSGTSTYAEDARGAGVNALATFKENQNKFKRLMLYLCQMLKNHNHRPDYLILSSTLFSKIMEWEELSDLTKFVDKPEFDNDSPYRGTLSIAGRALSIDLYEIPDELTPEHSTIHEDPSGTMYTAPVHFMLAGTYGSIGHGIYDPFSVTITDGQSKSETSNDVSADNTKQFTANSKDCIYPLDPRGMALGLVVDYDERVAA